LKAGVLIRLAKAVFFIGGYDVMDLKNCSRCGKVYYSANPRVCPDCLKAEEEDFKKVREFVKANPKVAIDVVVEACGVSEDQVRDYLRQGKIDSANLSGPALECRKCGKPIESGMYCVLCRKQLSDNFKGGFHDKAQETEKEREKREKGVTFARYYKTHR
jgi:hypothetical protein